MTSRPIAIGAGLLLLAQAACARSTIGPGDNRVPAGVWGGAHAALTVTATAAHIEFDCAHGDISRPLVVDTAGNLSVDGVFVPEHGGPVRRDEQADAKPARYSGKLEGHVLTLEVTRLDTNQKVGTFSLGLGVVPLLTKCL